MRGEEAHFFFLRRLEENRIRAEGRKSKPRDRADDPIRADSNGNGSFEPDGVLASEGFLSVFGALFARAIGFFFYYFLGPIENQPEKREISYPTFFFSGHQKRKIKRNLFVILRYTHRAPPL